jgi:hypothetical protein
VNLEAAGGGKKFAFGVDLAVGEEVA